MLYQKKCCFWSSYAPLSNNIYIRYSEFLPWLSHKSDVCGVIQICYQNGVLIFRKMQNDTTWNELQNCFQLVSHVSHMICPFHKNTLSIGHDWYFMTWLCKIKLFYFATIMNTHWTAAELCHLFVFNNKILALTCDILTITILGVLSFCATFELC